MAACVLGRGSRSRQRLVARHEQMAGPADGRSANALLGSFVAGLHEGLSPLDDWAEGAVFLCCHLAHNIRRNSCLRRIQEVRRTFVQPRAAARVK
jgi:hypothetical protein